MFLIKERIRDSARFGMDRVPEVGAVDWGKRGENVIEVPDALGRKLIAYGGNRVYREVRFPSAVIVVPVDAVEEELTPLASDVPPPDFDYPQEPVEERIEVVEMIRCGTCGVHHPSGDVCHTDRCEENPYTAVELVMVEEAPKVRVVKEKKPKEKKPKDPNAPKRTRSPNGTRKARKR